MDENEDPKESRKSYVPKPDPDADLRNTWQTVLGAYIGAIPVSEGARRLDLSRNHFQTKMHTAMRAAIHTLHPQPKGRRPKPARERELEEENERLRREVARLQEKAESIEKILGVATAFVRDRSRPPRTKKEKAAVSEPKEDPDVPQAEPGAGSTEPSLISNKSVVGPVGAVGSRSPAVQGLWAAELSTRPSASTGHPGPAPKIEAGQAEGRRPDEAAEKRLDAIEQLKNQGVLLKYIVALGLITQSTYERHQRRRRRHEVLVNRRGPGPRTIADEVRERIEEGVRSTHGVIGAAPLAKQIEGASRRVCAEIKAATLTEMERERKRTTMRVEVAEPGILRGMDQKYVHGRSGLLLVSADGMVPFRTTISQPEAYDGEAVRQHIKKDIEDHGAPLVYRLDLASSHRVPAVREVFESERVLVLHGPARCPQYYGQMERQNREHEAWLSRAWTPGEDLMAECEAMKAALNEVPRRTLGWQSAREEWENRPEIEGWRDEIWEEVQSRVAGIWRQAGSRAMIEVERAAIVDALVSRGLLRMNLGGWC